MDECKFCVPAAYYQDGKLLLSLVQASADGSYDGVDENGTSFRFRAPRFVLIGADESPVTDAQGWLSNFREQMEAKAAGITWEQFDWMDTKAYSLEEIADHLGKKQDTELFGLYLFISVHPHKFDHKNKLIRLKTEQEQADHIQGEKQKQERQLFLQEVAAGLEGKPFTPIVLDQLYLELPALAQESGHKDLLRVVQAAYPDISPEEAVKQLRISIGELPASLDPVVAVAGIPVGFAPCLAYAELVEEDAPFNGTCAFCIDDEDTRDYDDAISYVEEGELIRLGVHVSDVASQVPFAGALYQEAARRISSFYAVCGTVPMLPCVYSEAELSLKAGTERAVLSWYAYFDEHGKLIKTQLQREKIKITANLSFRQVQQKLQEEPFSTLWRLASALKQQRDVNENGDQPRLFRYFRKVGQSLQLKVIDHDSPARIMVEEFMILYNSKMAEFAQRNGIPVLYRNVQQYGGSQDQSLPSSAYLSTFAQYHPGIGTAAYLHATSPIRRFTDLVNHYQILAALQQQPYPLLEDDLTGLIEPITQRQNLLKEISHQNDRYWCLKYIEDKYLNVPLDAYLCGKTRDVLKLELVDWGKQVHVHSNSYPQDYACKVVFWRIDWDKRIGEVYFL